MCLGGEIQEHNCWLMGRLLDREFHGKCKQLASEAESFLQKAFQLLVVVAFTLIEMLPFFF